MKSEPGRSIKIVILCQLFCLITPLYAATPWLHTDGNKIKDPNGNVVVLRGVDLLDLGSLEIWQGGVINMIDRLTNKSNTEGNSPGWYPRVIRLAVYPFDAGLIGPWFFEGNRDYYYNNLLRPAVDYCAEKDMYAIIDWHYVANTYEHIASTSAFWNYMAPKFANDSHVLFELFQEPINTSVGDDTQDWLSVRNDMQTWINIVRSYAPNNLILVSGPSYSQVIGLAASYPLEGDNIVIVSHIYPGHWLTNPAGNNWYTTSIDTCLTRYPVFMSEWGFTSDANYDDSWHGLMGADSNYGQPLMNFREARQISNSAWVASYNWGPPMFHTDWTLRVGGGEMGGFVKDKLYEKRNNDQPGGGDSIAPDAPAGVTDTNGYGEVILDWDDNAESDIYGYNVYRSVVSGDYGYRLNNVFLKNSSFIDKNVVPGITYYYVVTAVDVSFNESEDSDEVSATPIGGAIYTFDGITQSNVNYDAYACDVDQFPFGGSSGNRNTMVEATDANYTSISANDSMDWTTVNPGSGDETLIWVEMKINEPVGDIAKIDLTFNGYTSGYLATAHRIYVMKKGSDWTRDSNWVQLGGDQSIYSGVYNSMTRSIDSNFGGYIDADGNLVWATYETTSAQVMHVNYLEMVVYGQGFGSPQPTVYITSPANGALIARDSNITIGAYASDADGRVAKVEFYQGSTKLGEDTVWPFSCTWNYAPTGQYVLTAKVIDDDNNITTSHDVNITVLGDVGTGAVLREWWTGISGTAVSDLTSNGNYPNQPSGRGLIATLQGPTNWADNYGTRIRGFLRPAADGNYTFTIAADDSAELWLSTDENPTNASLIAESPAQEESLPILLANGGKYYIEVLHKAGVGSDNISVSWQGPGISQQIIDGMYLSPFGLKLGDFARFATQWRAAGCTAVNGWCNGTDFDRDGAVLYNDLKSFAQGWLDGIE